MLQQLVEQDEDEHDEDEHDDEDDEHEQLIVEHVAVLEVPLYAVIIPIFIAIRSVIELNVVEDTCVRLPANAVSGVVAAAIPLGKSFPVRYTRKVIVAIVTTAAVSLSSGTCEDKLTPPFANAVPIAELICAVSVYAPLFGNVYVSVIVLVVVYESGWSVPSCQRVLCL